MTLPYKEYRCQYCHKLLLKGILVESVIEVKCRACHTMNLIKSSTLNELLCAVSSCPHRLAIAN